MGSSVGVTVGGGVSVGGGWVGVGGASVSVGGMGSVGGGVVGDGALCSGVLVVAPAHELTNRPTQRKSTVRNTLFCLDMTPSLQVVTIIGFEPRMMISGM